MKFQIQKAVVIGAGTMGASLAAHFANTGIPVTLLDIVPNDAPKDDKKARNKIVKAGWDSCLKGKPANIMSSELKTFVTLGNLEDDFNAIGEADLVIEAIIENLKIKQGLMERIDSARREQCIVATNTSGIPVKDIADGRSEGFKQHFLGMHFFNPPRYLKLLEVIPTEDTLPEVVDFISHFGELRLGKGIVVCKDTPNFIGNRLAFGTGAFSLHYILENDYSVDEVDNITGPLIGRPKTATFRLIDLVGIDVWQHVGENLAPAIPHDELGQQYLASERPAQLISALVERGWLGNKTKIGFYKMVREDGKKKFLSLDLETLEHTPSDKPRFDSIGKARKEDKLDEKLKVLLSEEDKAAKLVQALTYQSFQYASTIIPEVADTPKPLDDATRWGFMHEAGPFETWDMLGVAETVNTMKSAGYEPAEWVDDMLQAGKETFYLYENGTKIGVYDVTTRDYVRIERTPGLVLLKEQKEIVKNAGATVYDMDDGVACVEFHTKMNALDYDIIDIVNEALDRTETGFDGLVIGNDADNFSAGFNLFLVVMAAQQKMWHKIEDGIIKLQNMNMRMRYFPKPIVVAPAGLALGGGCEVTMHASRVVAAAETYIGLVEMGTAGVIPAGGGTKEYMRRIINPAMRVPDTIVLPPLAKAFLQMGQAKVATSAWEAREMNILGPQDRIVLNRDHLLTEAKKEVLHMANTGYTPPAPELIYAAGPDIEGAVRIVAQGFADGNYISEHDLLIAHKMAYVLTGGRLTKPQWVSEQYILDLEREAFLSLCGEEKTQARMWSILNTGKPLRN
jgi:3-hydroxyacyl-CoA dehydrogenase